MITWEVRGQNVRQFLHERPLNLFLTAQIRVNDIDLSELGLEAEGTPS